jgi:DNA modification methylase
MQKYDCSLEKHQSKKLNSNDTEHTMINTSEMSQTEHKINDDVMLYIGDSLTIPRTNKFRMIYFDPPFNSDRDYKLNCNSEVGFSDKWSDADYEEFIRRHIDLLYELLEDNGTLFFHISSTCMYIPEKILRNKFKLVEPIFWKKCRSKNNVKTKLGSVVDIIWKCNKNNNYKFNVVTQEKDATYLKNSFKNKDNKGNYALGHLVTENTKKGYEYEIKIGNQSFNPKSGWRIKETELQKLIEEDRVHIPTKSGAKLYKKIYLHENPGKPCTDLWDDIHSISQGNEERKYPTAKPIKLLERLIEITTDEGDYVYDPMCGSGTTAKASNNLNRKCIVNDINPDVVEIVKSRFQDETKE